MIMAADLRQRRPMMSLGAFVHETGQHVAAWRHPDAYMESGTNFRQMMRVAQTAERGLFDLFFLADSAAVTINGDNLTNETLGSLADVAPTILALMGIRKPEDMGGTSLLGSLI